MPTKRGKKKAVPAIVPRFLKGAVTIGVIPAIAACSKPQRMQPVVAYMASPAAQGDAAATPNPPVVAAYQPPPPPPVVAAYQRENEPPAPPIDAGVDAAVKPKGKTTDKTKVDKTKQPPPPVVAAMVPHNGE